MRSFVRAGIREALSVTLGDREGKKTAPSGRSVQFHHATSHLYLTTLYSGMNGIMIGTVFTYS